MPSSNHFVCRVGAEAGAGATTTGFMLARCFTRGGLRVIGYPEYPSLIKGGHNVYQIRVSCEQIYSPVQKTDLVIALNKDAIFFHKNSINQGGGIIYDEGIDVKQFNLRDDIKKYPLPFLKLLASIGADIKMKNAMCMGAACALIDYPFEIAATVLKDQFQRKGEEIVQKNIAAAKAGYAYILSNFNADAFPVKLKPVSEEHKMFLTGNDAVGLGALKAGMKLYAAYPMTPASNILHFFAERELDYNLIAKQTEDEIAAINYAVGAQFAGVRAMVGTSGGGFALMVETLGMAAIAETPIVIMLGMRTGPSTGMPTWTEQSELRFALHASQGEFLRVILAPGDVEESFFLTAKAFNIADKYQIPVIIMSDKFLLESHFSADNFDDKKITIERGKLANSLPELAPTTRFKRYAITEDGVSTRSVPGEPNGMHVATSYEHDETGFSSESFFMRKAQVEKRARKQIELLKEMEMPRLYGPKNAELTLITWGSQKLPALDAMEILNRSEKSVNLLHFTHIYPLDWDALKQLLAKLKRSVIIENNSESQFAGLLKQYADFVPMFKMLKYDGRQFFPEQLAKNIDSLFERNFKAEIEIIISEDEDYEYFYPAKYNL